MGCRTQGTRSLPYFYWLTHTQLLHFLGMKASIIWKNACKVFLTQDILAGADRSQIWFLPSACQLSARDRQHCEQGETVGTEGLDGASVNSLSCLLSQAQNTQHRALLVARDHREMSAPNSKPKDPTGGTEGGHPPPRPPPSRDVYSHGHRSQQFQDALPIPLLGRVELLSADADNLWPRTRRHVFYGHPSQMSSYPGSLRDISRRGHIDTGCVSRLVFPKCDGSFRRCYLSGRSLSPEIGTKA